MDEGQLVTRLLTRAADLVEPTFAPPDSGRFAARRQRRRRAYAGASSAAAGVLTIALVVALVSNGTRHRDSAATPTVTGSATPSATMAATAHSLAQARWSTLPVAPIQGRVEAVSAWTGSQLLIWGGDSGTDQNASYNDGAAYDPQTRTWSMLPASPLSPRSNPISVWTGSSLFIWGGYSNSTNAEVDDGALYTPASHSWRSLPKPPITAYHQAQAAVVGDAVILLSAADDSAVVNAQSYDLDTGRWTRLPDLTLPAGQGAEAISAISTGTTVYLWASWAHTTVVTANESTTTFGIEGFTYQITARRWVANHLAPKELRAADAPLWTGGEVLFPAAQPFCGGCAGPMVTNRTGLRVNPATGAAAVIAHGPVDDTSPTYLWTGAAMLALNSTGITGTQVNGQSAVWDPATNIWTRLAESPSGAGQAPVMVWTGKVLLEWGQFAHYSETGSTPTATVGLQLG